MTQGVFMIDKEIMRAEIFSKIDHKKISQTKAALDLNLSVRHVQRMYKSYKKHGLKALVSKRRGKPSNNQLSRLLNARIKELVSIELYFGFGPTFMMETLAKYHNITISVETTRQRVVEGGVWNPKNKKSPVVHQQRIRRPRLGEVEQIDGSPEAWFEDRGDPCDLIVFIDDATGRTFGRFSPSETTFAYMITLREYIRKWGIPLTLYSDKHGIFRINIPGCVKKDNLTQFGRACKELDIQIIYASTPQAKGRVERCNRTQQDRLIKEMRLAGINNIEDGNKFLETYWDQFNTKFAISPVSKEDAHRIAPLGLDLDRILCEKHFRKVTKNLEVQFENVIYQLPKKSRSNGLIGAKITVLKKMDGSISFEYKNQKLHFEEFDRQIHEEKVVSSKELDRAIKEKKKKTPSKNHPWNQEARAIERQKEFYKQ